MIVEQLQTSDLQIVGDVKQIKTSIDVKNIDFITTLLSSNLYSDPIGSFLREIVSNAWDAHVEAHNTEAPVIVMLRDGKITIRDYGTGLSKENFEDLYCKIGSSTKRESNEYIGGWGLGKFSSLAVSDVVYINNYHGGFRTNYIMVKENNTIMTNEMSCVPCDEHDGLEVSVGFDPDKLDLIRQALTKLVFFPNIFVDYGNYAIGPHLNVNKAVVRRYKYFSVSNIIKYSNGYTYKCPEQAHECWVLLGNVLYPLDLSRLDYWLVKDHRDNMKQVNLCLNVPIGSINVTPNREQIQYSEATVSYLNKALKNALDEIEGIVKPLSRMDCDDPVMYRNYLSDRHYWNPVNNTLDEVGVFYQNCWEIEHPNITYKGVERSEEYESAVKTLCYLRVPGFRNYYSCGRMLTAKGLRWMSQNKSRCMSNMFLAIEGNKSLTGYVKQYVINHGECWDLPIINTMSEQEFVGEVVRALGSTVPSKVAVQREAAKEFYDRVKSRTKVISLKDIEEYKESCQVSTPREKRDTGLYTLHLWDPLIEGGRDVKLTDPPLSFAGIVELLKKRHKRCIFHSGSKMWDSQKDDYKVLVGSGYEILWGTDKLYKALLNYKATDKGSRELGFLVFDYKPLLDNPDRNIQVSLVLARYLEMRVCEEKNRHVYGMVHEIEEFLNPEFLQFHKLALNKANTLALLQGGALATKYWTGEAKFTDPTARWLWGYVENVAYLVTKYRGISENLRCRGITNFNGVLVRYLWCRWCIKNHLKLEYKAYTSLLTHPLLEMIFKEKNL